MHAIPRIYAHSKRLKRKNKGLNTDLALFNVGNRYIRQAAFESVIKPFTITVYQNNPFLLCHFINRLGDVHALAGVFAIAL